MLLFDGNFKHPLNQLSFENQKYMISITMEQFREIPLCSGGYDEEGLRLYDGVLGNLMRMRDKMAEYGYSDTMPVFLDFSMVFCAKLVILFTPSIDIPPDSLVCPCRQ